MVCRFITILMGSDTEVRIHSLLLLFNIQSGKCQFLKGRREHGGKGLEGKKGIAPVLGFRGACIKLGWTKMPRVRPLHML